jgi:hypothetical protein
VSLGRSRLAEAQQRARHAVPKQALLLVCEGAAAGTATCSGRFCVLLWGRRRLRRSHGSGGGGECGEGRGGRRRWRAAKQHEGPGCRNGFWHAIEVQCMVLAVAKAFAMPRWASPRRRTRLKVPSGCLSTCEAVLREQQQHICRGPPVSTCGCAMLPRRGLRAERPFRWNRCLDINLICGARRTHIKHFTSEALMLTCEHSTCTVDEARRRPGAPMSAITCECGHCKHYIVAALPRAAQGCCMFQIDLLTADCPPQLWPAPLGRRSSFSAAM